MNPVRTSVAGAGQIGQRHIVGFQSVAPSPVPFAGRMPQRLRAGLNCGITVRVSKGEGARRGIRASGNRLHQPPSREVEECQLRDGPLCHGDFAEAGWAFETTCRNAPNVTIQAGVAHIRRPVFG